MAFMRLFVVTAALAISVTNVLAAQFLIKIHLGKNTNASVDIPLNEDEFSRLHECWTNTKSLSCKATLAWGDKKGKGTNNLHVVNVAKPELGTAVSTYNIFMCVFIKDVPKLSCSRLFINSTACPNQIPTQYFRVFNDSSSACVGLKWPNFGDFLFSRNIRKCNVSCNSSPASTSYPKPILGSRRPYTTKPHNNRTRNNDDDDSVSRRRHKDDDDRDGYRARSVTHIVIAIVVSIVVTAAILVSGYIFRRQLMKLKKHPNPIDEYQKSRTESSDSTTSSTSQRSDNEFQQPHNASDNNPHTVC